MAHKTSRDGGEFYHRPEPANRTRVTATLNVNAGGISLYAFGRQNGDVVLVNLSKEDAQALGEWLITKAES